MKLIVACDEKGGIGFQGNLPWIVKEELKLFRSITKNTTLIVGRKTAETLPLLIGRNIICLSRNKTIDTKDWKNDVQIVNTFEEAIKITQNNPNVFIAGGSEACVSVQLYDTLHHSAPSMPFFRRAI